jgi:hypothetical protein
VDDSYRRELRRTLAAKTATRRTAATDWPSPSGAEPFVVFRVLEVMPVPIWRARRRAILISLLLVPLASCGNATVSKHCGPAQITGLQLSVKGHSGGIARLLTGQAMDFIDAPDWTFRVSDRRVLKEDDCPGRATTFGALQPGSSLLEALWSPACLQSHPACSMPSRTFRVTDR